MRKIRFSILMFTLLFPTLLPAQMTDVKLGGDIRVRAESVDSEDATSQKWYLQKTHINLDAMMTETLYAYVSVQDSRTWGDSESEELELSQAYIQLDNMTSQPLSVRLGRQALEYGDQRLIGSNEWVNDATRFDAIKLIYNTEIISVDIWTAKLIDGKISDSDTDFNGVYAALKSYKGHVVDAYLIQEKSGDKPSGSETGRDIRTYGVRVDGSLYRLDYSGEAAFQSGDRNSDVEQDASAYAVKAGVMIVPSVKFRIGAEYDAATGNRGSEVTSEEFYDYYPSDHYLYGFTDDIRWSNIKAWSANISIDPMKDLHMGLEYWKYDIYEDNDAPAGGDKGWEINFKASYTFNSFLKFEAAWSRRDAGDLGSVDYFDNPLKDNAVSDFTYFDVYLTF